MNKLNPESVTDIIGAREFVKKFCLAYPDGFGKLLRYMPQYKNIYTMILEATKELDSATEKVRNHMATRCYWFINGISSWDDERVQCQHCHTPLKHKQAKVFRGYIRPHCNVSCSQADIKVYSKLQAKKINQYGSKNNIDKIKRTYAIHRYQKLMTDDNFILLNSYEEFIKNYRVTKFKFKLKCKKCEHIEYSTLVSTQFTNNTGKKYIQRCHKCFPTIQNQSKAENELFDFCQAECKKLNYQILHNDKKLCCINHKAIDFDIHIPNIKLLIEFDGCYWHSEQYYKNMKIKFPEKNRTFIRTFEKTEIAERLGYQLIHIFEDEWKNNKENILKFLSQKINGNFLFETKDTDMLIIDRAKHNKLDIPAGYSFVKLTEPMLINRTVKGKIHQVYDCGKIIYRKN